MDTLLITGASGFFGNVVTNQFAASGKYRIFAVHSGRKNVTFPNNVQIETADLLNESNKIIDKIKPDVILHLAWGRQDGIARNSESNIEWLEASCRLFRSFINNGGRKFVFASTSSEYENESGLRLENMNYNPISMYGETKRAFSSVANNYANRVGLDFVNIRLFTLYGENDQHEFGAIPLCINTLRNDRLFVCKAPNTIRDYVYVEDAARAVETIILNDYTGTINVSSGQPRSMKEVFSFIAHEMGKEELLHFENEEKCNLILVGDNSILREQIGFVQFTRFEEGMRRTINWWMKQG